jgi:hypothetical protein
MWLTLAEIIGFGLVVAGVWLLSVPAALIVAGLILLAVTWLQGGDR